MKRIFALIIIAACLLPGCGCGNSCGKGKSGETTVEPTHEERRSGPMQLDK